MNACFYDFFYSEINSVWYFLSENEHFHIRTICGGFLIILNKFFLLFSCRLVVVNRSYLVLLLSISLSYKAIINLAVLFRQKNPENQYMSRKKYGMI